MASSRRAVAVALLALWASACGETLSPEDPGNLVPKTVAEDATLPQITINGTRIHAQAFGDPTKPVVVLLHGGPGEDYRRFLRLIQRYNGYALTDDYYVVMWDQRGSGLSERVNPGTLTQAQYVADLSAILDHYAPGRKALLVGESWGAMFATRYINELPQRVAGAVLIESGPLDGVTMERLKNDITDTPLWSEFLNDWAWSSQFFSPDGHARMDWQRAQGANGQSAPRFGESKTDPVQFWRQGAAANYYVMKDGQNGHGKFEYDFTTHLSAYGTPVLFIAGERSEVLGASLQAEQLKKFKSATLQVISGAGHDVAWVKASDVVVRLRAYLNARVGGAQ